MKKLEPAEILVNEEPQSSLHPYRKKIHPTKDTGSFSEKKRGKLWAWGQKDMPDREEQKDGKKSRQLELRVLRVTV